MSNQRTVLAKFPGETEFTEVPLIKSQRYDNVYRVVILRIRRSLKRFVLCYAQNRKYEFGKPAIARCNDQSITICRIDSYEYR